MAPCDHAQVRERLGLPTDRPLVLFGTKGGIADPRLEADFLM
ncbi:hypothetical protein SynWH8103_00485 [Synechococcus sp. WH 8103]|nr:hypothetical protein SynWH8103_00485 [Synechococcus sp. WH 8103]